MCTRSVEGMVAFGLFEVEGRSSRGGRAFEGELITFLLMLAESGILGAELHYISPGLFTSPGYKSYQPWLSLGKLWRVGDFLLRPRLN